MSQLKDRLRADLSVAMKARDEVSTATLRMVLAAVGTAEVAGDRAHELSDDEVFAVLAREAKKRREAADAFEEAGRAELAGRERAEGDVVARYLPAPLDDAELASLVAAAISEAGVDGPRGMGAVMKLVQPRVGGRADGKRVAAEVKKQLAS